MNTAVGVETIHGRLGAPLTGSALGLYFPGYCISSCTLAFLGGVERQILDDHVIFAVHQISRQCHDPNDPGSPAVDATGLSPCPTFKVAMAEAQESSAEILAYIRRMGVAPEFSTRMSRSGFHAAPMPPRA